MEEATHVKVEGKMLVGDPPTLCAFPGSWPSFTGFRFSGFAPESVTCPGCNAVLHSRQDEVFRRMVPVGHGALVWRAIVTQEDLAERRLIERARLRRDPEPFEMLMSTVPEIAVGKDGRVRYVEGWLRRLLNRWSAKTRRTRAWLRGLWAVTSDAERAEVVASDRRSIGLDP